MPEKRQPPGPTWSANSPNKRDRAAGGSRDPVDPETPTVAHAVLVHLRSLPQNPLAGLSNLEGWADNIRRDLDNLRILEGLSADDGQQLAHLVTQLSEIEGAFPSTRPLVRERKEWAKYGRGRLRMLTTKTKTAWNAVAALRKYVQKIKLDDKPLDDLILTALAAFDVNALERIQFRVPGLIRKLSIVSRQRTDDALVNLYDWFVQRGLSPGESELRAATISNEYWDTHFTITEDNSDGEKSRGCDAVRKRVQRRRTKRDALNTPS